MGKQKSKPNVYLLFAIGTSLLVAAWLMRSFPLLIFAGLAPLFAISDHAEEDRIWNKLELVGVALAISLWAAHIFNTDFLIQSLIQCIALTLTFVTYTFARQNLGTRLGKLPLVLFWLALEYLFPKLRLHKEVSFLADSLVLKTDWYRWTIHTGYLGVSCWVLLTNLLFYHAIFQRGVQIPYLVLFCLAIAAPIVYSYTLDEQGIGRLAMESLYANSEASTVVYAERGEWIVRTATWVSGLIILFTIVKSNTRKK